MSDIPPAMTYANIPDRERHFDAPAARNLLAAMPVGVRDQFLRQFLTPNSDTLDETIRWFSANSKMSPIALASPGSALLFEPLYSRKAPTPVDRYFLDSIAGNQIHQRLRALEANIPAWLPPPPDDGRPVWVDNMGSGPGRDTLAVFAANPHYRDYIRVRCIDPDPGALEIGRSKAQQLGLAACFSFHQAGMLDVAPTAADLLLLIGILCPLGLHTSRALLARLKTYSRPGGTIIFSTALTKMVTDDPVTDFIMRLHGWHMSYKTEAQSIALATLSGWNPVATFFDEPLHHHCMVVATLPGA